MRKDPSRKAVIESNIRWRKSFSTNPQNQSDQLGLHNQRRAILTNQSHLFVPITALPFSTPSQKFHYQWKMSSFQPRYKWFIQVYYRKIWYKLFSTAQIEDFSLGFCIGQQSFRMVLRCLWMFKMPCPCIMVILVAVGLMVSLLNEAWMLVRLDSTGTESTGFNSCILGMRIAISSLLIYRKINKRSNYNIYFKMLSLSQIYISKYIFIYFKIYCLSNIQGEVSLWSTSVTEISIIVF